MKAAKSYEGKSRTLPFSGKLKADWIRPTVKQQCKWLKSGFRGDQNGIGEEERLKKCHLSKTESDKHFMDFRRKPDSCPAVMGFARLSFWQKKIDSVFNGKRNQKFCPSHWVVAAASCPEFMYIRDLEDIYVSSLDHIQGLEYRKSLSQPEIWCCKKG